MIVLDTHTLIWFLMDEEKLSGPAKKAIHESDDVFVSIASLWEIAIKQSIGKLDIESTIQEIAESCSKEYISLLNITPEHMEGVKHLSHIHSDRDIEGKWGCFGQCHCDGNRETAKHPYGII